MQPNFQLKNQTPAWNPKQRYRVKQTVQYNGSYWVNTTGINSQPVSGGANWVFVGSVAPGGGGSASGNAYKLFTVPTGATTIQDAGLIGAISVNMLQSSVAGTRMADDIDFDSTTGEITNVDVSPGEQYIIFYTNP